LSLLQGCLGGAADSFTVIFNDPFSGGQFYESDITGGVGPDGSDGAAITQLGISYFFVGLAGNGHAVWAPQYADHHTSHIASEKTISAALATVGGVRYLEVGPVDEVNGSCAIYAAGALDWPAPGPNYVRIGTSGTVGIPDFSLGVGLPLYARVGADPRLIRFVLFLTGGS
jgi:hypothetical protein